VDDPSRYYGLGVEWGDFDDDGWPDLYVANDSGPNYLYRNHHDGTFEDLSMLAGIAVSGDGLQQGSMGVDWGDYMRDGRMGMFVTNFTEQPDTLYRNLGRGEFSDVTSASKLAQPTFLNVGWGTGMVDFSNTGWLDIFIANGHVYPQMDGIAGAARYAEPMQLFRNRGDATFEDISNVFAEIPNASRRGAVFGDLNNDGNMDIVVLNMDGPPQVLLNQGGEHNRSVLFKLIGTKSNKMAIGAKLTVTAGKMVQTAEVHAGGSYLSSNDPRLHFGLASESHINEVTIRWPSGEKQILRDLPAGFIYTIVESKGITEKVSLHSVQ
jgi:hypothetical protein